MRFSVEFSDDLIDERLKIKRHSKAESPFSRGTEGASGL